MKKLVIPILFSSLVIAGCKNGCNKNGDTGESEDSNGSAVENIDSLAAMQAAMSDSVRALQNKDSALTRITRQVLTIFKNKQYSQLNSLIHPQEGVRFSPYATVSPEDNKFSREAFHRLVTIQKNKKISWGSYDGSGDPIELTPAEYFERFVYDGNFLHPTQYDINNFIKTGNATNNLKASYAGSDFTESHEDGKPQNGGIDWKSVRLVFKQWEGKYYLVGIVHDQWTI